MKNKIKSLINFSLFSTLIIPTTTSLSSCSHTYYDCEDIAPYLHYIKYDDYRQDVNFETLNGITDLDTNKTSSRKWGGCSVLKKGNLIGRNFDAPFTDMPSFLVKVNAKKDRHASLGMAIHYGLHEWEYQKGMYDRELELIPNLTMDGINDAGVFIEGNVLDGSNLEPWNTNPGKPDVHMAFLTRYILDHADSAEDAINRIRNDINLTGTYAEFSEVYVGHAFIADAKHTYLLEILENSKIDVKELDENDDFNLPISTNFYQNIPSQVEDPERWLKFNNNCFGFERYLILLNEYENVNSIFDMFHALEKVKISNTWYNGWTRGKDGDIWFSEYLNYIDRLKIESDLEAYNEFVNNVRYSYMPRYWKVRIGDDRWQTDFDAEFTIHSSVYDIEKKQLVLSVQEDYIHRYYFSLK